MPFYSNDLIGRAPNFDDRRSAKVKVATKNSGGLYWDPETCSGYAPSLSRMTAITDTKTFVYAFPYEPLNIEISNIANEYSTIERPGDFPLVEYRGPQLQQVSFSFLAVNRYSHGLISIEPQLLFLNKFAALNAPIMISGTGHLLESLKRTTTTKSFRSWRISEFSISTLRKNDQSKITQAECSITLIEDRNPTLATELIPRIVYTEIPIEVSKKPNKGNTNPGVPIVTYFNAYDQNVALLQNAGILPGGTGYSGNIDTTP